jgi:hypothetical protein
MPDWANLQALVGCILLATVTAVLVYGWTRRIRIRERLRYEATLKHRKAAHRRRLLDLEQRTEDRIALLEQTLEQTRLQYREQLEALEKRLAHSECFDPHQWLSEARARRREGRHADAMSALRLGLQRTEDALCEIFVDLALHHFVLRLGLSTDESARELHSAERYARLAALLKPNDRFALLLLEDIADARDVQRIGDNIVDGRTAAEAANVDEDAFFGADARRASLVAMLVEEAAEQERAGRLLVAEQLAHRAQAIALREFGPSAADTVPARQIYACTLFRNGAYEAAFAEAEAALRVCAQLDLGLHCTLPLRLLKAEILVWLGHGEAALSELDALLGLAQQAYGPEHDATLELRRHHALALSWLGQVEPALQEMDETLSTLECRAEHDERAITCAHAARAEILNSMGRGDEALEELETILPVAERVFGVEHRIALSVRWQRALALHRLGRNDEAFDDIETLLSTEDYLFGAQHPLVLKCAHLRARILHALGRGAEALQEARRLLPLHAAALGGEHRETQRLGSFVQALESV